MKIKKIEKLNVKEDTGCLTIKNYHNNHNFALTAGIFVKNSSDGRGSDITSIGGNPSGFAELDDIHYFQKKLYMSLKYPMSRVVSMHESRNGEIVFGGNQDEIARDEIKWAKFLEKYQNRLCSKLLDLFILHLKFIGYVKQYDLDVSKLRITMTPPNNYIDKINQSNLQTKFDNYQNLSNNEEFPKSFLMRRYLDFNDEDFEMLNKGWKEDEKYNLKQDTGF